VLVHCASLLGEVLADKAFIKKNIEDGGIAFYLYKTAVQRVVHDSEGVTVAHHDEQEILMLIDQWIAEQRARAEEKHSEALFESLKGQGPDVRAEYTHD